MSHYKYGIVDSSQVILYVSTNQYGILQRLQPVEVVWLYCKDCEDNFSFAMLCELHHQPTYSVSVTNWGQ